MAGRVLLVSETAYGAQQGTREPGQLQPRQYSGLEPVQLAELAITDDGRTLHDAGLVNSVDVSDSVPVGVADLEVRPAEHVQQAHQLNVDPDLLAGLPDRRCGWRLAHVNRAAEETPPVVMTCLADQQHPPCPIHRQDRHRRQHQQIMPDNGPQPGYMRSDTHPRNPTA
jgi:hypothetical protein